MTTRPRDPNQLARMIVDISTGEAADTISPKKKATNLKGQKGGLKGGHARANKLSPEERSEIARVAASARWKKGD